jgi:hypothetical protein
MAAGAYTGQAGAHLNSLTGVPEQREGLDGVSFSGMYAWSASQLAFVALLVDANGNLLVSGSGGGGGGSVTQGTVPWVVLDLDETTRVDTSASPIIYSGSAAPGSSESASVWKIQRINTSNPVTTLYANGAATYVNSWTNRASLSYS